MAPIIEVSDDVLRGLDLTKVPYKLVKSAQTPIVSSIRPVNNGDYILLDREHQSGNYSQVDLLVPFEKTHLSDKWNNCKTPILLASEQGYMPSIRQHVDSLKLIKSGKAFDGAGNKISSARLQALFKDMTGVKSPYRAEWLDAKFGDGTITYHSIEKDGSVRLVTEKLDKCLMRDKTPGISLDSWLKTADAHGLPTSKTRDGDLYFWYPRNGAVAWFDAGSDWAILGCDRIPSGSDDGLGVRVARKK